MTDGKISTGTVDECSLSGYDLRTYRAKVSVRTAQQIYTFDLLIGIEPNGYKARYYF